MDNENVVPFPANQQQVAVEFGTERALELSEFFRQPVTDTMNAYLHQWEEGPCDPQEMADRMSGALMAAEASLRAALHMVSNGMGIDPMLLTQRSLGNIATAMVADLTGMAETVQ